MRDDQMPTKANLEQEDILCGTVEQEIIKSLKARLVITEEQLANSVPKESVKTQIKAYRDNAKIVSEYNYIPPNVFRSFADQLEELLSNQPTNKEG